MPRLTGERPVPGSTPASLLALHEAGYRELAGRIGDGVVLDAGCGLGFATATLGAPERTLIGVDYDCAAAEQALRHHGRAGLLACCSDVARLGLRGGSVDWACSSHVVEHFDTPARHVAEMARILKPTGTAIFLTPNGPWDFENPYHLVSFTRDGFKSLLEEHFGEVTVSGLEASDRAAADFEARRAKATRVLRFADPLDLRKKLPRRYWIAAYSRGLPLAYRLMARAAGSGSRSGSGAGQQGGMAGMDGGITAADYTITEDVLDTTPVLVGVASEPTQRSVRTMRRDSRLTEQVGAR